MPVGNLQAAVAAVVCHAPQIQLNTVFGWGAAGAVGQPMRPLPHLVLASCSLGLHTAATRSQVLRSENLSLMTCRPDHWYPLRPVVRQCIVIVYVGRPWLQ